MSFSSHFNDTLDPLLVGILGDSWFVSPSDSYPNRNSDTLPIIGVMNTDHIEVDGVNALQTTFTYPSTDITGVTFGSMVDNGTLTYKVVSVQPDETGMTTLFLEKR